LARVFAIADVFDALTSRRPYKPPMSFEDAWKILERDRGAHFDPVLLDNFRRISRGIHARVADRADDGLKALLAVTIGKYFR
jgi:HD-GYP domain-containing protein (c-di-GMP phosphodiesterase class II)